MPYRFLKDLYSGSEVYAIHAASGITVGDMMQWDTGSRVATPNTLASGSIYLGISEDTNPMAGLGTAARPLTGSRCRIKSNGVHEMTGTNGETYSHLDAVYQGATVQTVTSGPSAGRMVGRVWLPDGSQVTGTATAQVPVSIMGSQTNCGRAPSALAGDR